MGSNTKLYISLIAFKLLLFNLILGTVTSCQSAKNEKVAEKSTLYNIDIEKLINNKTEVLLSEIATNVQYIPLETNPDIYLSKIINVEITKSYIFALDNESNLFQYDREGKFIRKIGSEGKGPGEYIHISQFAVSEKLNTIVVSDHYRLIKYDMQGKCTGHSKHIGSYYVKYSNGFVFYRYSYLERPVNLIITDQNLVRIKEYVNTNPKPKPKKTFSSHSKAPLYVFDGNLFFKEHYNDTLFMVVDSIKVPHIVFAEKDMILDYSLLINPFKEPKKYDNKVTCENNYESHRFIFTNYIQGSRFPGTKIRYISILFNKETNRAFCLKGEEFSNDFDGGINIRPTKIYNDTTMINYIGSLELKALVNSETFKNSIPKYPEKKRELEKLAKKLTINDNPVLMLVKLKS